MSKEYKGSDIGISPGQFGWGEMWFADGYKAQISGGIANTKKDGKEYVKFYLRPLPHLAKRYEIDLKEDLDKNLHIYKMYPRGTVRRLNQWDPARPVYFCMLNWDAEEVDSTEWLDGKSQQEIIEKLREEIEALKVDLEKKKEELIMANTDTQAYIKKNIDNLIGPMLPHLKKFMLPPGYEEK